MSQTKRPPDSLTELSKRVFLLYNKEKKELSDFVPRPRKLRNVCSMPEIRQFGPKNCNNIENNVDSIIMTVEEMEVIRLIDYEQMNQNECADMMGVARSTVQRIYEDARKKIAECLIKGSNLVISGGDYQIIDNECNIPGRCGHCHRRGNR